MTFNQNGNFLNRKSSIKGEHSVGKWVICSDANLHGTIELKIFWLFSTVAKSCVPIEMINFEHFFKSIFIFCRS